MPSGVYNHTKKQHRKIARNRKKNGTYVYTEKMKKEKSLAMKGRDITWADKISKALQGHEVSAKTRKSIGDTRRECFKNGKIISWNQGLTKETDERVKKGGEATGKALKGKYVGKKSWNWLGGISFDPYGIEFNNELKEKIRKRDNYICQECEFTEKQLEYKLVIHHIDYNKKNNNLNNLISLCRSCHSQTNFKRENWIKYFKNKLYGKINI